MTSDFNPPSIDRPRERAAPGTLIGHWSGGVDVTINLTEVTLVVAIKSHCDGCLEFINADVDQLGAPVIVVSADEDDASEWRDARQPVLVSSDALRALDVKWPPLYVLIDPVAGTVLTEGVLFGVEQVASEIAPFLRA